MPNHWRDWNAFALPPTFTYSTKVYRAKNLPLTNPTPTHRRLGHAVIYLPAIAGSFDAYSVMSQPLCLLHKAAVLRTMLHTNLMQGKKGYKANYNKHVRFELDFAPGNVYVHPTTTTINISSRSSLYGRMYRALPRQLGVYKIISFDSKYIKT